MRRRACCGLGRARAERGYRVRLPIARAPVARSICNRNVSISRVFTSDSYENIRSCSINHSVGGEMAYPPYVRARARELRIKNHLSLDELAEHLALPKTTIYYWIKDLPLGRDRRESPHNGTRAMQAKYRRLREAAYEQGQAEYDVLLRRADVPGFRGAVHRGGVQAFSQHGFAVQLRSRHRRTGSGLAPAPVGASADGERAVPRRPGHEGSRNVLGRHAWS